MLLYLTASVATNPDGMTAQETDIVIQVVYPSVSLHLKSDLMSVKLPRKNTAVRLFRMYFEAVNLAISYIAT